MIKRTAPLEVRIAPAKVAYTRTPFFADPPPEPGADPGAANPPPSADDSAILDFKAPDIGAAFEDITRVDPPPKPPVGDPPPKPAAPPATPPPKPPAAPDPGDKSPAGLLRAELHTTKTERDAAKTELDALKKKYEAGDPRVIEAQTNLKAREDELKTVQKQRDDYEAAAILANPALAPEIAKMNADYDKTATALYRSVPEMNDEIRNGLLAEYRKLPFGKPEYAEARTKFENAVNAALGAADGTTHRKLDKVIDFIEASNEFASERAAKWKDVSSNYRTRAAQNDKTLYGERSKRVDELIVKAREIPDGLETTDPLHPKVALANLDKVLKPEDVAALDKGIPEYVRLVVAGIAPRTDEDYTGLNPEQIKEARGREIASYDKARDYSVDVLTNGLRALRRMPYLMKELQRLSAKVKEGSIAEPPDPTKPGGGNNTPSDDDALRDFKAPAIPDIMV